MLAAFVRTLDHDLEQVLKRHTTDAQQCGSLVDNRPLPVHDGLAYQLPNLACARTAAAQDRLGESAQGRHGQLDSLVGTSDYHHESMFCRTRLAGNARIQQRHTLSGAQLGQPADGLNGDRRE
ncbi:hypothetical protein ABK046_43170 [Streptomyces caeruleatus]|nr:hypothetical protein [Streptomyces sp. RP5T]